MKVGHCLRKRRIAFTHWIHRSQVATVIAFQDYLPSEDMTSSTSSKSASNTERALRTWSFY
jgi:hypothetical protein